MFDEIFGECHSRRWRGGWGFEEFGPGVWGAGWMRGKHGRGGRGGRMFDQGDLKYVILRLLEEKPRHGYEIIKALEERSGGAYSPSPGTVYPTLTMLEDLGYARGRTEEGGKKIYEITDEGRAYLAQHATTVDDIFERMTRFVEGLFDTPMAELNQAAGRLVRAAYGTASRHVRDAERLRKIRETLDRATREIEELGRAADGGTSTGANAGGASGGSTTG
jgi:DNA-binding PadR family transcriptional regulator